MPAPVICCVLSCIALSGALLAPAVREGPRAAARPALTRVVVLRRASQAGALIGELQLRLRDVEIVGPDAAPTEQAGGELTVFVTLETLPGTGDDTQWKLELVTSDGRGFDRRLSMDTAWNDDERTRFAAANIAQLCEGVEAGTVVADREAVPPLAAPPRVVTTRAPPEVIVIPGAAAPGLEPPASSRPPAAVELSRSWRLGAQVAPAAVLGLGRPRDRSRFAGGGGAVAFVAHSSIGVVTLAEVRGLRASVSTLDASLSRMRVSVGSGFLFSTPGGGGEVEVQGALSVEPWWVARGGERVTVPGRTPAIGAWGRVVAGAVMGRGRGRARLGGWMEIAGSGVADDGGLRVAGVSFDEAPASRVPAFRVGGVEVSAGLELRMSFLLRPRPGARRERQ